MSTPSVCLVILNYNGRGLLGRFLPSLTKSDYSPLEIVVVDNASSDDSVGWLRTRWPQITLLRAPRNLSWPGGNNLGVRYALEKGHRYILLANNDIEPHPRWIHEAVQHAQAYPEHGVIGYQLFNLDVTRPAFEASSRQFTTARWCTVDHVTGCAMLCDAEIFKAIGLFDEVYFNYAEETDWEIRAMRAGWQMAELDVPIWHLGEGTLRRVVLRRSFRQMRGSVRLKFKLHGILEGLLMCKTVLNRACNPWARLDFEHDYTLQRYRPASLPVNGILALGAIGWNLVALPQTLYAGYRDQKRIATYLAGKKR